MTINHGLAWLAASIALFSCTSANAVEGPIRKPGLWEMRVQAAGHTRVTQICVDAASETRLNAEAADFMKQHCTKNLLTHQGNKYISDTDCSISGTHIVNHSVITAIGDSAFHTEGTAVADSVWLGPCRAGQKPGVPMMQR